MLSTLCLVLLCSHIIYALLVIVIQLYSYLALRKTAQADITLLCKRQQFWQLVTANDHAKSLELRQALLWPWVCCLSFYCPVEKKRYFFSVFKDALEDEEWRKLRVLLSLAPLKKARL